MWQFQQSTGQLTHNGILVGVGYSGHGKGIDNPEDQSVSMVGPVPEGNYTFGPPHTPIDILGPMALPLIPDPSNHMFGRSAFFMHGDNAKMNHTASNGCIIMGPAIRHLISNSSDKQLTVIT